MSTSTSKHTTTPSTVNHKPAVEPVKAPEAASTATSPPVETVKSEVQATPATADTASKVIISISVEPKLARQARLLARFQGVSISSLFTDAAALAIPVALKAALADLKDEVE